MLIDALSAMEGTYTKQCDLQYTFIHDSMYEIFAYHYGKQFPDQMLLYMKSDYVANYVKPHDCAKEEVKKREKREDNKNYETNDGNDVKSFDLCIRLSEDQYPLLAERLYRDIERMELHEVFSNDTLKHPQVCQAFIDVLKKKEYKDIKSLFVHKQENIQNLESKNSFQLEGLKEKDKKYTNKEKDLLVAKMFQYQLLMDERFVNIDDYEDDLIYNVRVISWLIYYGHQRILRYILQETQHHEEAPAEALYNIMETTLSIFQSRKLFLDTAEEISREKARLLLLGCYSGNPETVESLIPDNNRDHIITKVHPGFLFAPLTAACEVGCVSVVEVLLNFTSDVNLVDQEEKTPLVAACERGHASIVETLVEAGADVNKPYCFETPLVVACEHGHLSIVEKLLKAGAKVNKVVYNMNPTQEELKLFEISTPLEVSCKRGDVGIVEKLLSAGPDVDLLGMYQTPLIAACECGHASIVERLLKAEASVNKPSYIETPLIAACRNGHLSIVEMLIEAGADVNLYVDDTENSPIIAACDGKYDNIVERLVKAGADVNITGRKNDTPLIAACKRGDVSIVEKLLTAKIDFKKIDSYNLPDLYILHHDRTKSDNGLLSTLFVALINNKQDVVDLLIKTENSIKPNEGYLHLFNILLMLRHADVKMDLCDDVVIGEEKIWTLHELGYLWRIICEGDCDVLRYLLSLGMQVNHLSLLVEGFRTTDVKSLLCILLNEEFEEIVNVVHKKEKLQILLEAGADVNVSILEDDPEKTKELRRFSLDRNILSKNKMMIMKHIRRHSI